MTDEKIASFLGGRIVIERTAKNCGCIKSNLPRLDESECLSLQEHFNCDKYNASIDAIESLLLSFAAAGLLKEGEETDHAIQTTLDALENRYL